MVVSDDFKTNIFDNVINDETSITTALKTLTAWRSNETLVMIGDDFQLALPVLTGLSENPSYQAMSTSTFACFRDLHMPAFLLNEQMRMPAGMVHLSNDIIYSGKLIDGRGTALADSGRAHDLKIFANEMYYSLQQEPEHLIYPVMLSGHWNLTAKLKHLPQQI